MTEVVRLDAERARRRQIPPMQARPEPATGGLALAWRVVGTSEGHRRVRGQGAACGATGALVLAEPGTPPCRACWPGAGA